MKWYKGPLTPEQTREWIALYQRDSKLYAWGFFIFLHPVVFGIIWWSMGELNKDVFLSLGFFSLVTFILAVFTRRKAKSSWSGMVTEKGIRQRRVRRDDSAPDRIETYYEVVVSTGRGKSKKIRCNPTYFEYIKEGDVLVKVPGYDWPEKVQYDADHRICIVCGNILDATDGNCPRCRGPVPHHGTLVEMAEAMK